MTATGGPRRTRTTSGFGRGMLLKTRWRDSVDLRRAIVAATGRQPGLHRPHLGTEGIALDTPRPAGKASAKRTRRQNGKRDRVRLAVQAEKGLLVNAPPTLAAR